MFFHRKDRERLIFLLLFYRIFEKLIEWKVNLMEKRFKLTVEDVLEKQFNIDFKGYSSGEVDEFLDLIIADYQQYNKIIEELGDHLQEYEKQINSLKAKIVELEGKQGAVSVEGNVASSNVDILKRLSRLENEVFRR